MTTKPKDVFIWAGLVPPPDMVRVENHRTIYRGVLVAFDNEFLRLEPPERFPKTFFIKGIRFTDKEGNESEFEGPVNYLDWLGVSRKQIESVRLFGRARPAPPSP